MLALAHCGSAISKIAPKFELNNLLPLIKNNSITVERIFFASSSTNFQFLAKNSILMTKISTFDKKFNFSKNFEMFTENRNSKSDQ